MSIFKAYDIRGLFPEQIDNAIARNIGRAFGSWINSGPIVVGRDMRQSGIELENAISDGIRETGIDVISIGFSSTPMLNFSVANGQYSGGVMITASHNPGRYNGFKLCKNDGIPLSGDDGISDIQKWIEIHSGSFQANTKPGRALLLEAYHDYKNFCLNKITFGTRPLKIVIDCGNGVAGNIEYDIIKSVVPNAIGMYLEPDGSFPNHEANPLVEKNLIDLKARVLSENADAGIAFDGDADRVFFVDEKGKTIQGDMLLALMAVPVLQQNPGSGILYDLRSSWAVKEEIQRGGGTPIRSRVGHSFIKKTLREKNGILGGEVSGHFYFRDFFYLDSGICAALKVLDIMSRTEISLSELTAPFDRYPRTGEINFEVDNPDEAISRIQNEYKNGKQCRLDGLTIEYDDWWFNLRKSNTEPMLRLNIQAKTKSNLESRYETISQIIGGSVV